MIRKALVKRGGQIVEVTIDDSTYKNGGSHGGLDRWFAEEWVDIKTGKPCGRQEGENRKGYPACRPSKRVSSETPKTANELSSSEKAKFKRAKQSSSRIPYQHKRRQEGGESNDKQMVDGIADILSQVEDMNNRKKIARNMLTDFRNEDVSFNYQDFLNNSGLPELKSGGNKPTNPALWSRAKALAKSKFDVYPSAYANGWAAKWYKGKGGGWRKAQMGGEELYNAGSLPEFEITENTGMYNPNIVGPSAPRYIPSETGFIPNPYYTTGSGSAESVPLEMFAAPIMRGASSLIGMIPGNVMTTFGAGAALGLEGCAPGQKCKGLKAHPNYKKSWGKSKKRRRQEGGEESDQMEEILDQIEDALQQGAQPEEILQQLIQMGINQEQAQGLIQEAMQDLQEDAQEEGNEEEENNGEEKEMEDDEMYASGGSYRVYKTSERKGKTHKVVGPGGVTKYFGDPKLGERSKSKYGKKGFYARHKKNLAKNPFFRAYARATWAEGGEPSFMQTPEFKTNSFVDLVRQEAESNAYKNIMDQAQELYMQMGGITNYGYTGPNKFLDMYEENVDNLKAKGNVEGVVVNRLNNAGLAIEQAAQMAANLIAPGSGALVKAGMDAQRPKSITDPTSQGMSTEGMASMLKGLTSDPQALAGLVARYGGSIRKFQVGAQTSVPGFNSDMTVDPWSNSITGQPTIGENILANSDVQQYFLNRDGLDWYTADQSLNTPALTATPDNLGVWSDDMTTYTPASFGPKNQMEQPGVSTEGTNPNKDPLLKPAAQQPKSLIPRFKGIDWLGITKDLATTMGNRGKAKMAEAKMADMTAGDNVFAAVETLNRGDFERNTGMLKPDQYIMGTTQGIPALARYGGNLKRAKHGGVQKDGVYMSYPTATPESVVYGEQPKKPSNTLQPVKRELANLEAEVGETAITPAGVDGVPKFWKIGGERHSNGGTPLNLPDGSFIFSDTKSMKLGGDILEELGIKGKKKRTPAEISKMLGIGKGYDKYVMIIQDPNSDKIERRTAELMIENQIKKLGMLALAQEAKKGFPEGIPMIAVPYMESVGIAPEQILPQPQMGMEEISMPQQMPMAKYGMQKYQTGREKQTNPLITSSPSTPDNPNIAQRILGPLSNYFASKPKEEETPIETNVKPVEIVSPVKGFESMEDLDEFISKGDEFGQDFNALYNDYSQTIKTIDQLRTGLIEGWIPLEEYEQYKEGIDSRIGEIKTEIDESQKRIPFYKSWGFNPSSTADKLQDIAGILDEEKDKLKFRASDLRKFRNFQNNVSFLETEKQNILELLNSDIDNLERMRLKRRLTDLNDALNYETDRTNQFGEKAFKTSKSIEGNTDEGIINSIGPINISRLKNTKSTFFQDPKKQYGRLGFRKFTYDDYLKQYESSPITSKAKPSYESQQGSLNAVQDTVPAVQDTVPVVAPSTPAPTPTESKPKSVEKKSETKKKNKVTFGAGDLNGIQIIQ